MKETTEKISSTLPLHGLAANQIPLPLQQARPPALQQALPKALSQALRQALPPARPSALPQGLQVK